MRTSKQACIRVLLDELAKQVSLKKARLATLAGEGLESELWTEYGIKPEHGLLIDRNPAALSALQANPLHEGRYFCRSRVQDSLPIIDSYWGKKGVDFFHLDFYGVIESDYDALKIAAEAVNKSKGKTLAVTFANERQNIADDCSGLVWSIANQLIEAEIQSFTSDLVETNAKANSLLRLQSDPLGQSRRELGFFLCWLFSHHLAKGLKTDELYSVMKKFSSINDLDLLLVPNIHSIVRINYGDQSRMKTIQLMLDGTMVPMRAAARSLVRRWSFSPLYAIDAVGEVLIVRPARLEFLF